MTVEAIELDIRGQVCPSCLLLTLREVNRHHAALAAGQAAADAAANTADTTDTTETDTGTQLVTDGRAYSAFTYNVECLVPWRTLTGRPDCHLLRGKRPDPPVC